MKIIDDLIEDLNDNDQEVRDVHVRIFMDRRFKQKLWNIQKLWIVTSL
ncbi:MAG TPA: hypothetical protein HA341_04740 [Halobacteria archaeon]|nr:hypothetical protein [Halobacteria archaeon]